jgi:phosphatidylglycerol:prolipoprotein diacylglycerol transferase
LRVILTRFSLFGSNFEIYSYSFFMALGMLTAFVLSIALAKRKSLPFKGYIACLVGAALAVPVGARLLFVLTNISIYAKNPFLAFSLDSTGFALYGGFFLAAITTLSLCKLLRLNIWKFADSITPGIGIGLILSRVGCFLNGCCFGTETNLPWGMVFPVGSQAGDYQLAHRLEASGIGALFSKPQPVHPTQLYEMTGLLIALGFAFAISQLGAKHFKEKIDKIGVGGIVDGTMFTGFILAYTIFRWINHYFRVPSNAASGPTWLTPLIYGLIIVTCGLVLYIRFRNAKRNAKSDTVP